jgi:hypothetical protein
MTTVTAPLSRNRPNGISDRHSLLSRLRRPRIAYGHKNDSDARRPQRPGFAPKPVTAPFTCDCSECTDCTQFTQCVGCSVPSCIGCTGCTCTDCTHCTGGCTACTACSACTCSKCTAHTCTFHTICTVCSQLQSCGPSVVKATSRLWAADLPKLKAQLQRALKQVEAKEEAIAKKMQPRTQEQNKSRNWVSGQEEGLSEAVGIESAFNSTLETVFSVAYNQGHRIQPFRSVPSLWQTDAAH